MSLTYDTSNILDTYNNTGSIITTASSPWLTIDTTAGNIYTIGTGTINSGTYINYPYSQVEIKNPLKDLYYSIEFELDKDRLLSSNIKSIRKNKFIFSCNYVGNRIQPYELIMKLINEKKTFSVKVKVSDILSITYVNFRFTKIENNLDFSGSCDFSQLKVRFKCDKILFENHKLSEKELRADKLKKIIENSEV